MVSVRQQRAVRATASASLATFVALLSHVAAGGPPPSVLGIALPWALSLIVCLGLAGRRLSVMRVGAAVAAAQAVFHVLFALGVVPLASAGPAPGAAGLAAHAGHMPVAASSLASVPTSAVVVPDAAMLGAHVIAAVVTTLVLHRGELLLVGLGELARRVARRLRAAGRDVVPPTAVSPRRRGFASSTSAPRPRPLIASPARRGPPSLLAL